MESTSSHEAVEVVDTSDEPIIIAGAAEAAGRLVDIMTSADPAGAV